MILRILRNEKYVGDLLQKKYITKDYLKQVKIINNNEEDKIFIPNHHEAIVDRNIWNRAQEELQRRSVDAETKKKYSNRYWCSGKIICSDCGERFVIRRTRQKSGEYIAWACHSRAARGNLKTDQYGKKIGCNMRIINNKSLLECMRFVTEQIGTDFDSIADELTSEINELLKTENYSSIDIVQGKLREMEERKIRMLDSYFANKISSQDMETLKQRYDEDIERLNSQLLRQENQQQIINTRQENLSSLHGIIKETATFSESVYGEILDKITVYDDYMLIKLKYLDFAFKIRYSTHGYKEKYTTVIEECQIIEMEI